MPGNGFAFKDRNFRISRKATELLNGLCKSFFKLRTGLAVIPEGPDRGSTERQVIRSLSAGSFLQSVCAIHKPA